MFDKIKQLLKLNSIWKAFNKSVKDGFDWKHAVKNAVWNFLILCAAVGGAALADYFSIPANVDLLFQWLPESVRSGAHSLVAPFIGTAVFTLRNWAKNRQNEIRWVVETEPPTIAVASGVSAPVVKTDAIPVPLSVKPAALGPPAPSEPLTVTGKDAGVQ